MKLLNPSVPPQTIRATKLKAVVLDWAGTAVDFGSMAPARTLQKLFAGHEIHLADAEVRRDMGLPKKEHIRQILAIPRVGEAWRALEGRIPAASDVDELYATFIPLQLSCLAEYSALIPGVVESVSRLRARGLKIGSTTGYTREMLNVLLESSAKAGYKPDCSITPEDVGIGRPAPFMLYENATRLRVYPLAAIAKVGDTAADVEEALNAGAWAIGVAGTGNGIGMAYEEFQALSAAARASRLLEARRELEKAGAHYVVDSLTELVNVVDDIDSRLR